LATNLSAYFQQRRLVLGLRPGEVVRRMGYKSIVGTTNKVVLFEERGDIRPDLFDKLKAAFEIDDATVVRLIEEDRREFVERWNQWANQPIEPHLVVRAIPGVYMEQEIPHSLSSEIAEGVKTPEAMEQYAADFAKQFGKKVWLVLSRRLTIFFDENGTKRQVIEAAPGEMNGPYMQIGGCKQKFLFTGGMGMRPLTEPEECGPQ